MMKNLLAAIGLFVVGQKSFELYREYSSLKREKEQRQQAAAGAPTAHEE
jgi:hypothetical protein